MQPDFWTDPKKAEILLKQIRSKKIWTDNYDEVTTSYEDFETLMEFLEMKEVEKEEVKTVFDKTMTLLEDLEFKKMQRQSREFTKMQEIARNSMREHP